MKEIICFTKEELLLVNGGSQESYDTGYAIGRFIGDGLGALKSILSVFRSKE